MLYYISEHRSWKVVVKYAVEKNRKYDDIVLQILRAARSKVQQTARRCANEYWTQLSQDIQTAAITGNIRGMYDGIKKALGHTQSKTAPLKSSSGAIITDKGQQMERWVEHYSDLYSRENTVSPAALDVIECLPTMDELDSEPSVEDLLARICTTGHEGLQNHYPIQEQGREERL